MADEQTVSTPAQTATAESASTPAFTDSPQAAEVSRHDDLSANSDLFLSADDAWSDDGKGEEKPAQETKTETTEQTEPQAEDKQLKTDDNAEADDEIATLEEAFSDKSEPFDREKIIGAMPSRRKKAEMSRIFKQSDQFEALFDEDKPIAEAAQSFAGINPERYQKFQEHAGHTIIEQFPEGAWARLYVSEKLKADPNFDWQADGIPPLADVMQGKAAAAQSASQSEGLAQIIADLNAQYGTDWRDPESDENFLAEELPLIQTIRTLAQERERQPVETSSESEKIKALEKQIAEITGRHQSDEQAKFHEAMSATVDEYRASVSKSMMPFIARNTGLEINETDTPEIKEFKTALLGLYGGYDHEKSAGETSQFEHFALNHSSVKEQVNGIYRKIAEAQEKATRLKLSGKQAEAQALYDAAGAMRKDLFDPLAAAHREFKKIYIEPILKALGSVSTNLTERLTASSDRVEVVGNGSEITQKPKPRNYRDGDDVWDSTDDEIADSRRLRAA